MMNREDVPAAASDDSILLGRTELISMREIFPDETDSTLLNCLQNTNWNLDSAVLLCLEQQSSSFITRTLPKSQSSSSVGSLLTDEASQSPSTNPMRMQQQGGLNSRSPIRRSGPRRVAARMTLPNDFICVPSVRTVIDSTFPIHKADSIDFTVYINRSGASLGLNVEKQGGNIVVSGLSNESSNTPGLSYQAGVRVGDVLHGVNFEYFNTGVSKANVTKVVSAAGPFLCLHFIRYLDVSRTPYTDGSTRQHAASLRKIHPCALMLLDQEVLDVEDMEVFCESLQRLKSRTIDWSTGVIRQRTKIRDIAAAIQSSGLGAVDGTGTRDDSALRLVSSSSGGSSLRNMRWPVTGSTAPMALSAYRSSGEISDIRQSWYKEVTMSTRDIQPAISIRITGTTVIDDHTEYVLWVQDVSTGLQWYTTRRFREFFKLRETLVSLWGVFGSLPFPARRLSVGRNDPSGSLVAERRPLLETFLRSAYQVVVAEHLVHPATRKIFLAIYRFVDVSHNMPSISAIYSQQKRLHDAYIERLMEEHAYVGASHRDDEECTIDYLNDPFIFVRRWVEIYIHSILQLPVFRRVVGRFVRNYLKSSTGDDSKSWDERESVNNVKSLGEFIDNLQDVLLRGMRTDVAEVIEHFVHGDTRGRYGGQPRQLQKIDEDTIYVNAILKMDWVDSITQVAVRRQIETEVYVPCADAVRAVLNEGFAQRDKQLVAKCQYLRCQPQSFFGIPLKHISPSSWEDVVRAIDKVPKMSIPFDKLQLLVAAAKQIPEIYRKEHPDASISLGADDMLPIFIYCLAMSKIRRLSTLSKELENVCDSECRVSEIGYYTATLEASLQHILDMDEINGDIS